MVVDAGGGDVFLLLPRVLLEGGALVDGYRVVKLNLLAVGRMLGWVRVEGGGVFFKTILPMGGRPLSKGTTSEQASKKSSPFLVDLGLAEPFLPSTGMFITFIFFSQPVG